MIQLTKKINTFLLLCIGPGYIPWVQLQCFIWSICTHFELVGWLSLVVVGYCWLLVGYCWLLVIVG